MGDINAFAEAIDRSNSGKAAGSNDANNVFDSTNVVANRDGSLLERNEFVVDQGSSTWNMVEKTVRSTAQTLSSGATIFTIANGPVIIQSLFSICTSNENSGGAATTLQWRHAPTTGTAATFSGASTTLASAVAGSTVFLVGTTLATAPTVTLTGGPLLGTSSPFIVCFPGTITTTVVNGPSTASWQHYLRYVPVFATSTVS